MPAGRGGFGKHGLSPNPDKTIRVWIPHRDVPIEITGQVRIRDGVLVIYDDLPDGDFFTIVGIPLTSIHYWSEGPG